MERNYLQSLISHQVNGIERKNESKNCFCNGLDATASLLETITTRKRKNIIRLNRRKLKNNPPHSEESELDHKTIPTTEIVEEEKERKEETDEQMMLIMKIPLPAIPSTIPLLTIQQILITQYVHSLLYQYGLIPLPYIQMKKTLNSNSETLKTTVTPPPSYQKRLLNQKLQTFLQEIETILQVLQVWIEDIISMEGGVRGKENPLPCFGVGFGPSINNLKRMFLLQFPPTVPLLEHPTDEKNGKKSNSAIQSDQQMINRMKRIFIQKLIEFESSTAASPSSSNGKLNRGNIFFFLQYPTSLTESLSSSTNLLEFFYSSETVPRLSNYLQQQENDTLPTHQQKKWKKKLVQMQIVWNHSSDSSFLVSSPSSNDEKNPSSHHYKWLLLRKGIKPLKSHHEQNEAF